MGGASNSDAVIAGGTGHMSVGTAMLNFAMIFRRARLLPWPRVRASEPAG